MNVSTENQNTNDEAGPRACCLALENQAIVREYGPGRERLRCRVCEREFLFGRMFFDDSCIEPMDYEVWREAGENEIPTGPEDFSDFIMNRKPYFARNAGAAGAFQRVD